MAHLLGQPRRGDLGGDLFAVPTLTFRTLSVLLFISHERRALVHLNVTAHPTAGWVWQQLREATPWGRRPST